MNDFPSARLLLAAAIVGLGISTTASADPPSHRAKLRRASQSKTENKAPEPLKAPPSEVNEGAAATAPATRLEVPAGTDIKITIEVLSKPNPTPPTPPVVAEVPGPEYPPIPHFSKVPPNDPIWAIERIKPMPLPPIPDDPPPHEGAFFDIPYVVEPPDLIAVEVLEALPGRPISGERLVRPDGTISLGFYGEVHVRGLTPRQIKEKLVLHLRKHIHEQLLGLIELNEDGEFVIVEPKDTDRVFVDVYAYNSKNYFVQGDVAVPGRLPITGNETVLDAMNHAGGFIPSADPKNITLVRPARGGKPAKVYKVDLEAIKDRGESEKNYQLFPGDRIIVGRNAVVQTTIEIDRFAAPMQTVFNSMLQHSFAIQEVLMAASGGDAALTPAQRHTLVKESVDFWWKMLSRPEGAQLDEKSFREALMRAYNPPR